MQRFEAFVEQNRNLTWLAERRLRRIYLEGGSDSYKIRVSIDGVRRARKSILLYPLLGDGSPRDTMASNFQNKSNSMFTL